MGTPIIIKSRSGLDHFELLLLLDSSGSREHTCLAGLPGTHFASGSRQVSWGGVGDNAAISDDCQAMRQALRASMPPLNISSDPVSVVVVCAGGGVVAVTSLKQAGLTMLFTESSPIGQSSV